jgi:hypothetical protein
MYMTWDSYLQCLDTNRKFEDLVVIVNGKSKLYDGKYHTVLYKNKHLFFDPSPINAGIIKPEDVIILSRFIKS